MHTYEINVSGFAPERTKAESRGKALAWAWRHDAFNHLSFKEFMRIARVQRIEEEVPRAAA